MADRFNFNADQRQQLSELLAEENRSMWSAALYGIYSGDDAIVTVALSQIGNVGGQPYWSWYGFNSRVEWCACFVSWCANECGYIDSGVIPKFAGCVNGVQWFRTVDNGRTAALSRLPVRSFSSIGTTRAYPVRRTGSPIMSASWKNAKTALSTPSRAIPATAADSANIRWDTTKF